MTAVLIGVGVLGGLGLVLGLLLTVANKVFEIPSDPKRDAVRNALPGANCGGCGFAGCDALADAIAAGKAPVNACPVGGAATAAEIAGRTAMAPCGPLLRITPCAAIWPVLRRSWPPWALTR